MPYAARKLLPWLFPAVLIGAAAWALSIGTLPPADFAFCNGTEAKSVDPHRINGQPEGRVADALFEGLCRRHPKTLEPIPAVAESWTISDDKKTYTFKFRSDAKWSDGTPVTADDFYYSWRRCLLPATGGEYAYQLFYIKNAARYTKRQFGEGDPVEVELLKTPGTNESVRGSLLFGKLKTVEGQAPDEKAFGTATDDRRVYVVETDGKTRRFTTSPNVSGAERCETVLYDFREVGVKVVDPQTLVVTLENPTPYFLDIVAYYPMFPVNRRCVEAHGYPAWTKPENIVGNGAFRLEFRRIRDRIRLRKSDTYWNRANVSFNTVDVLAAENLVTMLNLYLTGEADWITDIPNSAIPELMRTRPKEFAPVPQLASYFYRVNVTRKPLDDPRVRRALSMAVNRQEIVEKVTKSGQIPALSIVPPGINGYTPAFGNAENISAARKLLAEAGYPDGRGFPKIEILYNTHETHKSIAELLQHQWKQNLGIDVGLRNQEWGVFNSSQRKLDYDVSRMGWIGDYNDPNTFLDMWTTGNENNQTGWGNKEYDRLLKAAAAEGDPQKRMRMLQDAEAIATNELPVIPLYYYVSKDMIRSYVDGYYDNIRDEHPLWSMSIDPAKKAAALAAEGLR
ncbi:MAG: peptide ABC transporter substrate-binding protein [Pirellulales bacterium]